MCLYCCVCDGSDIAQTSVTDEQAPPCRISHCTESSCMVQPSKNTDTGLKRNLQLSL